jgi:hypothetical protein
LPKTDVVAALAAAVWSRRHSRRPTDLRYSRIGATFSVFATTKVAPSTLRTWRLRWRWPGDGARLRDRLHADLRRLATLVNEHVNDEAANNAITAPDDPDPALARQIALLRSQGKAVIVALPGEATAATRRVLVRIDNEWRVVTR